MTSINRTLPDDDKCRAVGDYREDCSFSAVIPWICLNAARRRSETAAIHFDEYVPSPSPWRLSRFVWARCLRGAQERLTFTRDVAPVLFEHCVTVPSPRTDGAVQPADLRGRAPSRHAHCRRRAEPRDAAMEARAGPRPIPAGQADDSTREIAVIQEWVAQGMMRGSPADLPPPPTFSDAWQLGTPDVVVQMAEAYVLPAQRRDVFRTFVIPIPLNAAAYVRAVEFLPGNAEGRASREHQSRSHASVAAARRR